MYMEIGFSSSGGYPLQTERQRLATALGAELIYVEAIEEECLRRLLHDTDKLPFQKEWQRYIHDWFLAFRPDSPRSRCEDNQLGTGQGTTFTRNLKISNFCQSSGKNFENLAKKLKISEINYRSLILKPS